MTLTIRALSILPVVAAAAFATTAPHAAFPDKQITVLVGAGAGGSTDAGARITAQALEKVLGQPIVVVNKPGGGGSKALIQLKSSKPDGYTLAYAYSHHVSFGGQYKRKKQPYTADDFGYVGSVTWPRFSIVSLAGRGWTDLPGMIKKLKADGKPLRLVYSGGPGRLIGTALTRDLKFPVKIIRVRGGGKSMQRVLGGHVDVVYSGGAHTAYTDAGKTIVVASVDNTRNPDYPKAPTLKELGIDAATPALQIVVAPKGLPAAVLSTLAEAVARVTKDPQVVKLYRKNLKMRIDNRGPAELAKYMRAQQEQYRKLIASYSD